MTKHLGSQEIRKFPKLPVIKNDSVPIGKMLTIELENWNSSAIKLFTESFILFYFVN